MTNFFNYTFILCVNNFHIKYLLLYVFYTIYYEIFFKISIYFIFKTKIFILIKLFKKKKKVIKVKVKNFHHFFPIIFSNLKINVNRLDHLINLCTLLHREKLIDNTRKTNVLIRRNENRFFLPKRRAAILVVPTRSSYVISFPTSPLATLFHEPQRDVFTAFVALPLCRARARVFSKRNFEWRGG